MVDAPPRRSGRSKPAQKKQDGTDMLESTSEPSATRGKKRKAAERENSEPADEVENMLTNPKGKLASVDMTRLINANTWACLSPDSRAILSTMLPSAAFAGFHVELGPDHPSRRGNTQPTEEQSIPMDQDGHVELDPAFLSSTFLEAAVTTFQDSLVNGYFTKGHRAEAIEYEKGVRDGMLHAAWKDEKWDEQASATTMQSEPLPKPLPNKPSIRLSDLASKGLICVGDIISYGREIHPGVRICKDILVQSIHKRTHALTVLFPGDVIEELPSVYLGPDPAEEVSQGVERASVTTLAQLEYGILDEDPRATNPSDIGTDAETWSRFSIWRTPEKPNFDNQKGGRVLVSSLAEIRDLTLE